MSTVDTSGWSQDTDLNSAIEGIPLNADAPVAQTWKAIQVLMAAHKGDASNHNHGNITSDGKLGTASRAVVTDGSKAIGVSSVTATELGYLSGVTSGIQSQLNGLAMSSGTGWLRLPGNIQICWGSETISGNPTVVNYAKAFSSTPATVVTAWTDAHRAQIYTCGSGKFSCRIVNNSGTVITSGFTVFYIAIGSYS